MFSNFRAAAIVLLVATIPPAAYATDRRPNPADANVSVPVTTYRSVFTEHRKAAAGEKIDWRRANETVRDVGGHAGALKDEPATARNYGQVHGRQP